MELYLKFIEECKQRIPTENYHKHHIIPKFMGGTNDEFNKIKLSYQDHQNAHIILAECFPKKSIEYNKNIWAARILNKWLDTDLSNWKVSSGMLGKKHSAETKKILELHGHRIMSNMSEKDKASRGNKISKAQIGRTITWNDKISENHADVSGNNNPMYGKSHSKETKRKISKKLKGNANLGGRKGKTFSTFKFIKDDILIHEAFGQNDAKQFCVLNQISYQTLCKKTDTWKNWKCIRNKSK
jgi:hypothetical protein